MTTRPQRQGLTFYPQHYFCKSPTANSWAKLTAAGVHALRPPPNIGNSSNYISSVATNDGRIPILYHLNHPICFIRLIGTVVALDAPSPGFALLTLDDSSGATVEVKIRRLRPDQLDKTGTHDSNTTIPNVHVKSSDGVFDVLVDGALVDIGTVLNVKCTLDFFRGVTQLLLKRCSEVKSTADEARGWAATAAYMRDNLSRPWVLSAREQAKLDERYKQEQKQESEYKMKKARRELEKENARAEWRRHREERERLYEEKQERRRKKEEVLMNRGALV